MSDAIEVAVAEKAAAAERLEKAIVRAVRQGRPISNVARLSGFSRTTVYEILARRGLDGD